jgi:hypothetical protein
VLAAAAPVTQAALASTRHGSVPALSAAKRIAGPCSAHLIQLLAG